MEVASKIGSAAASRNPRAALSATPDLIKFATSSEGIKLVQKGRGLYLVLGLVLGLDLRGGLALVLILG